MVEIKPDSKFPGLGTLQMQITNVTTHWKTLAPKCTRKSFILEVGEINHHIILDGRHTSELSSSVSSALEVANTQEYEKKRNSDGLFCFEYTKQAVQEK